MTRRPVPITIALAQDVACFKGSAQPTEIRLHPDTLGDLLQELTGERATPGGLTPLFSGIPLRPDPSLGRGERLLATLGRAELAIPLDDPADPPRRGPLAEIPPPPPFLGGGILEAPPTPRGRLRRFLRALGWRRS